MTKELRNSLIDNSGFYFLHNDPESNFLLLGILSLFAFDDKTIQNTTPHPSHNKILGQKHVNVK